MSFLGAGIGYRKAHHDALLDPEIPHPRVLEIIPDHFFAHPEMLAPLAERYAIVFHDVGLSIGTAGDMPADRIDRIAELARIAKPVLFSDHLAITRSPSGIDLGHLAPIWLTREVLALVTERVRRLQDALDVPVALENIASPFTIPGGDFSEPELFAHLVGATGCGLLLDLTNLSINARNAGQDAAALVDAYPIEAVMQVHLAGGFRDREGVWIDSHSEPVEDASYALLAGLSARTRRSLRAIVIERDEKLGTMTELLDEARRAERIWKEPV